MSELILTEAEFRVLLDGGTVKREIDGDDGFIIPVGIRLWSKVWGTYSETKPRERG